MIAIESENPQSMKQQLIKAQANNVALRERLKEVQQYFSNPSKYSGAWPEWYSATIEQLLCKANPGAPLLDELEIYKRALDMALDRWQHSCTGFDPRYRESQIATMKEHLLSRAKAGDTDESI